MWVQIRSLPTWSCVESLRVFLSVVTIQHSLIFNLFFFYLDTSVNLPAK